MIRFIVTAGVVVGVIRLSHKPLAHLIHLFFEEIRETLKLNLSDKTMNMIGVLGIILAFLFVAISNDVQHILHVVGDVKNSSGPDSGPDIVLVAEIAIISLAVTTIFSLVYCGKRD
jgi:hypothetical protein